MFTSLNGLNDASSQRIVIMRIKRIIEKYPEVWRVFHEPIQNAIDAIQRRNDLAEGHIVLKFEAYSGKVIITDNGSGFPENMDLLLPDGTDKDERDDTLGYQGVGLKSVIYSSEQFRLLANTGDASWGIEINNAKKYLHSEGREQAPIRKLESPRDQQGTTLEIVYGQEMVICALEQIIDAVATTESNFRWRGIDDVEKANYFLSRDSHTLKTYDYLIEYYLRTQTYIGSVNRLLNCPIKPDQDTTAKKVTIDIEIDLKGLRPEDINNAFLMKVILAATSPKNSVRNLSLINKFLDFQEIIEDIRRKNPRHIPFEIYDFDIRRAGIHQNPTLKDQIYCKLMTPNYSVSETNFEKRYAQYISLLAGTSEERTQKNIQNFRDLFPKILGIYILIGRLEWFEQYLGNNYGMKFIAANGIPTQHELTPRSSNQSFYFNPITFILNVDGKLNEGKTHLIDQTLERKCVRFFREAFESSLNRLAQEFVRTVPNTDQPPEVDLVDRRMIAIDGIDIKREPIDENTLIVLFYQLLAKKEITLPTYGLLSQGVYDGKFVYTDRNVRSNNDLKSIEFKVKLGSLLNDFYNPNSPKQFSLCDLIVVWEASSMSSGQQQDYRIVDRNSVDTTSLRQSGAPDWVTTLIKDNGHIYRPIVIVSEWVEEFDSEFSTRLPRPIQS